MNRRGSLFPVPHCQDDRSATAREIAAGEDTRASCGLMIVHFDDASFSCLQEAV